MRGSKRAVRVINPLIVRLRSLTTLPEADLREIEAACIQTQTVYAHRDIIRESERSDHIHVMLDGWGCRYKTLVDGERQLPALLLPGDICDMDRLLMNRVDYGLGALTNCTVALMTVEQVQSLIDRKPAVRDAFLWLTFVDNSVANEWAVCLGRRSALERLAHLFCELMLRLTTIGVARAEGYPLPMTQQELSDAMGLSVVHVNRICQSLRAERLINLEGRRLTILDWEGLARLGRFKPDYLHLGGMAGANPDQTPISVHNGQHVRAGCR